MTQQNDLSEIKELLMSFFEDEEKVELWLNTENPNLGGVKPLKLMESDRADKVIAFIKSALDEDKC